MYNNKENNKDSQKRLLKLSKALKNNLHRRKISNNIHNDPAKKEIE